MVYSSKEIIDLARQLSQTQDSQAFSFQLLVHLLNNVYTGLYNELATSQAFMSEFRFTGTEADLPSDCYKIVSVSRNSKYFYLNQSSNSYNIPGTYSIENSSIVINGENGGEYTVRYQTLSEVLKPIPARFVHKWFSFSFLLVLIDISVNFIKKFFRLDIVDSRPART